MKFWFWSSKPFELPHDKINKIACAPSEYSDQPGHYFLIKQLKRGHQSIFFIAYTNGTKLSVNYSWEQNLELEIGQYYMLRHSLNFWTLLSLFNEYVTRQFKMCCGGEKCIFSNFNLIYISLWIDCLFEIRKIAVCFLWLSLPGDYRVTDEALLAETT